MNKIFYQENMKHTIKTVLMLIVGATLILWSWNNTLPTIFGLPAIHFKESIGLVVLALSVSFIFRQGRRSFRPRQGIKS